jgi:immunoglobulin-binding protein 1
MIEMENKKNEKEIDEEIEEEIDKKTYKDREWDEFKEYNPKGSGNMKR